MFEPLIAQTAAVRFASSHCAAGVSTYILVSHAFEALFIYMFPFYNLEFTQSNVVEWKPTIYRSIG
jgi:hypothetical protein